LFPGGVGTAHMRQCALEFGFDVYQVELTGGVHHIQVNKFF